MSRKTEVLFCVFISNFVFQFLDASNVPRGADPSYHHIYNPSANFKCLDGSSTIPFDRVNDDYCDCLDGSDEPGTAACPNGVFYCLNEGYKPEVLPSSRVGDGVCDCCDGSDEYSGLIQCNNDCSSLGEQLRASEVKRLQLFGEGFEIYKEYVEEGTNAKKLKQTQLVELEAEKELLEAEKDTLETIKREKEIPEEEAKNKHKQLWEESKAQRRAEKKKESALKAFAELDTNSDGKVSVEEMQSRQEFDIDANGEVSQEEAKEYMEDDETIDLNTFHEKIWINIEQIFKSSVLPVPNASEEGEQGDGEINEEPVIPPSEEDDERNYGDDEDEDDADKDEDTKKADQESDISDDEQMPPYYEETQNLIRVADEARGNVNNIEAKLKEIQQQLDEAKKVIDSDFGPNSEFYHLRDQCFDWSDREYVYKLCPFERATQRNKNGGSETTLGYWSKWVESDNMTHYSTMYYDKGQNCWNGPDRSTKVVLECGKTNELTSASEPNRCEYKFTFSTPAACNTLPPETSVTTPRQEL